MDFRIFYSILIFCLFCGNGVSASNKLIVVMIDGCKWDSIDDPKANLKGIPRIIKNGVRASYLYPVFPSLSYPNWYSIVTGLYPENHGFINNMMYDNDSDTFFTMLPDDGSVDYINTDPLWWNEAEPIWITAEKNDLRSALYWWAGCEVEIRGAHPMICERYRFGPVTEEDTRDFLERIDDVVEMFKPVKMANSWFKKDRLSLALMYYGPVDDHGHRSGPNSIETRKALQDIDGILDKMLDKLKNAGLEKEVNIMVVSDHGMTEIGSLTKYINLDEFSPIIKYQVSSVAESMIVPEDGMLDYLYNRIKDAKIEGIQVYKKEDIPNEYHIKNGKRMTPLLLVADKGYYIKALTDSAKRVGGLPASFLGRHGYDPYKVEDMRGVFFATGPDFLKGAQVEAIHIIDLYNIMCNILHIEPLPNNGSWEHVEPFMKSDANLPVASHGFDSRWHQFYLNIMLMLTPVFLLFFRVHHTTL